MSDAMDSLVNQGCAGQLVTCCFNMGDLEGEFYLGGNHKIPRHLCQVPHHDDPNHPDYRKVCNMIIQALAHGGKGIIAGCEAYRCEENGDIARCFNALGYVTAHNQPTAFAVDNDGTVTAVTCPPQICMVKSATPDFYRAQGLNPEHAGKVTVLDSNLVTYNQVGGESACLLYTSDAADE